MKPLAKSKAAPIACSALCWTPARQAWQLCLHTPPRLPLPLPLPLLRRRPLSTSAILLDSATTPSSATRHQRQQQQQHQQLPDLDVLMRLLERKSLRPAFAVLKKLMDSDPQSLAHLPPQYFTTIIASITMNTHNVVKGTSNQQRAGRVAAILELMHSLGIEADPQAINTAIHQHSLCGNVVEIHKLQSQLRSRNLPAETQSILGSLVQACMIQNKDDDAMAVFHKLCKLDPSSTQPYNLLIRQFSIRRDTASMLEIVSSMITNGPKPDQHTYATLASAFTTMDDFTQAHYWINEFRFRGFDLTPKMLETLVILAIKQGSFQRALDIIEYEIDHGSIPFSSRIHDMRVIALAGIGDRSAAWKYFAKSLKRRNVSMDVQRAMSNLVGCISQDSLKEIERIAHLYQLNHIELLIVLASGFAEMGSPADAQALVELCTKMSSRPSPSINWIMLLVAAHANAGDAAKAFELLQTQVESVDGFGVPFSVYYLIFGVALRLNEVHVINGILARIRTRFPDCPYEGLLKGYQP